MPERTGPGQFSRRRFLGAMAAAGVASFVGTGHAAAPPGIRGILLIVGDDHGAQLGCLGTEGLSTPILDGLAAEGVLFRQNFCSLASCSPSRASLFTGLYPHSHGIPINCHEYFGAQPPAEWMAKYDAANRGREVHDDVPTMVEVLKRAGYRTGITQKFHLYPHRKFPFDAWLPGRPESITRFVADCGDQPFFLMHNIPSPHRPFQGHIRRTGHSLVDAQAAPPPGFLPDTPAVRADWAEYLTCVEITDDAVGQALEALRRSGRYEDTLILYCGDNGPSYHRGKMSVYDFGLRVPLIAAGPGVRRGVQMQELTSLVDLMPTLADYAGAELPRPVQGTSLRPLLEGQTGARGHAAVYGEVHFGIGPQACQARSVFDGRYHYLRTYNTDKPHVMCADNYQQVPWGNNAYAATVAARSQFPAAYELLRVAEGPNPPAEQLFDVAGDRWETRDLSTDQNSTETLQRLRGALDNWIAQTKDTEVSAARFPAMAG